MYRKEKLDNGLRIITHNMPQMQSVAVGIWIAIGGRYEDAANKGISHYLEHLLFKGSQKYSCRKIKEAIEGVGGSLNGFTSEEATCYLAKLPQRYLGLGLDVLSDMVINPLLPQEEVEKERTVIHEELKMYKDQPQSYVYELLDELLWPNQMLGLSIIGTENSINSITRKSMVDFKSGRYTPANIVVAAAGSLQHDKFVKRAQKAFSKLEGRPINVFAGAKEGQSRLQLKILPKETEQTHLAMGFHSFKREHPLKYAQGLLHVILGGNMSSRLFEEVREKKGLAYEIGTHVKRFQDTGAFLVHAGIDNRKVEQTISVILKELEIAKAGLVGMDEFRRAKEFYLGQLSLALEDTLDHMLWLGESMLMQDRTLSLKDLIRQVNKVTRFDLREAARQIFRQEKINLSLIGPLQAREQNIIQELRLN
ncbi:MAG: pitrilysin family protein [Candidatus Omnitrophota bacterium]